MSSSTATTSNEWMQFYEQTVDELSAASSSMAFSDATVVATSVSSESNPSSSCLNSAGDYQLTPKGSSSKPIRRRSRVSKKTPTTLLNANTSNFRALVQQFTGCPNAPLSLGSRRGPINLSFAVGSEQSQSGTAMTSTMSGPGNDYGYYQQSHHQEQLLQQLYRQQQQAVSFDNVHQDAFFPSSGSSRANADQIIDGFDLENISLQGLPRDYNGNANDSNYFL